MKRAKLLLVGGLAAIALLAGCSADGSKPILKDDNVQLGGATPDSFPGDFPLPEGSEFILASGEDYQFNVAGTAASVLAFFDRALRAKGLDVIRVADDPFLEFAGMRCGEVTAIGLDEGGVRFNVQLQDEPCEPLSTTTTTTTTTELPPPPTTAAPTTTAAPPTTTAASPPPTTATAPPPPEPPALVPGAPCALGSDPDCIDPDGDGQGEFLRYGAECMADLAPDLGPGICTDLDGDGMAGYPDSG